MAWKVEFERGAEDDLIALGVQGAREVLGYLHNQIAHYDDPRRVGHKYGDRWRYRANGVEMDVEITESAPSGPMILVLAIQRVG
jgi:hypothetical protein